MDSFNKLRNAVEQRKLDDAKQFREQSKTRLLTILEKKLRTTFIGDIAAIEAKLGFLWGIDYKDADLTDEERKFKILWDELRTNILDRGNAQIRALKEELKQHTVTWDGYNYSLKTRS